MLVLQPRISTARDFTGVDVNVGVNVNVGVGVSVGGIGVLVSVGEGVSVVCESNGHNDCHRGNGARYGKRRDDDGGGGNNVWRPRGSHRPNWKWLRSNPQSVTCTKKKYQNQWNQ